MKKNFIVRLFVYSSKRNLIKKDIKEDSIDAERA